MTCVPYERLPESEKQTDVGKKYNDSCCEQKYGPGKAFVQFFNSNIMYRMKFIL